MFLKVSVTLRDFLLKLLLTVAGEEKKKKEGRGEEEAAGRAGGQVNQACDV